MSTAAPPQIDSPRAWLVVLGTFLASFVSLGIAYSFGAFFADMADEFDTTRGQTAVVFGLTTFAFFWLSLLTGRAADLWGPRPVLAVGALALLVGGGAPPPGSSRSPSAT